MKWNKIDKGSESGCTFLCYLTNPMHYIIFHKIASLKNTRFFQSCNLAFGHLKYWLPIHEGSVDQCKSN